jgi:type IV secretion system protein VirD4
MLTYRQESNPIPFFLFVAFIVLLAIIGQRKKRIVSDAYGTAAWCSEVVLRASKMLCGKGLVLGRTVTGKLIRIPEYVHVLLIGGSGSGKGVSIIIPNLLDYRRGGLVVFDPKGDLFETAQQHRKIKKKIIRFAPFNGGGDFFNPLDTIPPDSPLLVDNARAMAEALVVRQGTEPDPHWSERAVQVITAILVYVLHRLVGPERSLNSVQDIASDPMLVSVVANKLKQMGGIAARFSGQLKTLFDSPGQPNKEGSSVLGVVARHLMFLDSQLVAHSVSKSTFTVSDLLEPGNALFLQIPGDQLEAQRGLVRCFISTLIRVIGSSGNEEKGEVLFLLDEASALGSLAAVKEALVRGRSAGVRLLLAYQSASQLESAFKDEHTVIYDNCSSQIWLLPPGSYETAERISKSCGDFTQWVQGTGTNEGGSRSNGKDGSTTKSWGSSTDYKQAGRALLRPEEVLSADENLLIAFIRGLPGPVLAERIKWYKDADFNPKAERRRYRGSSSGFVSKCAKALFWTVVSASVVVLIAYLVDRGQYNQPFRWNPPFISR